MEDLRGAQEISIETSDLFMGINAHKRCSDCCTIFFFIVLLILSGILGFNSPAPQIIHGMPKLIEKDSNNSLNMHISKISPFNNYYKSYILLNHFPSRSKAHINLNISIASKCFKNGHQTHEYAKQFRRSWQIDKKSSKNYFIKLPIDSQRYPSCDEIDYSINYARSKYMYSAIFKVEQGNRSHFAYFTLIKLLYFAATLLIYYWFNTSLRTFKNHCKQQLYTKFLLVLFLCLFPLSLIRLMIHTNIAVIVDEFFFNILYSSIMMFSLYLLDDLHDKMTKNYSISFTFKFVFCSIHLLVSSFKSLCTPFNVTISADKYYIMVHVFYVFWLLFSSFRFCCEMNNDIKYRLKLYLIVSLIVELVFLSDGFAFINRKLIAPSAAPKMVLLSSVAFYVYMMTFFHWPYDIKNDQDDEVKQVKPSDIMGSIADPIINVSEDSDPISSNELPNSD